MALGPLLALGAVGVGLYYLTTSDSSSSSTSSSKPAGGDGGGGGGGGGTGTGGGGGGGTGVSSSCLSANVAKVKSLAEVQQMLVDAGYSVGSSGADGKCGNDTKSAVKKFQADNSLSQTGVVDELTYAALEAKLKPSTNAVSTVKGASAGVSDAQSTISSVEANGGDWTMAITDAYQTLAATGTWTADSKSAYVTAFQKTLETSPGYESEGVPGEGAKVRRKVATGGGGGGDGVTEASIAKAATLGAKDASDTLYKLGGAEVGEAYRPNRSPDWSDDEANAYDDAYNSTLYSNGYVFDGYATVARL